MDEFDPQVGDKVLVIVDDESTGGVVVVEDGRTMDVSYDGQTATFTVRTNGTWVKKGERTDSGVRAALIK